MGETVSVVKKIPRFASEEEAREFWDTHSSADYWDQMEDVTDNPPADLRVGPGYKRSAVVVFSPVQYEAIVAAADAQDIPIPLLLKRWIADRLEFEQERDETPGE